LTVHLLEVLSKVAPVVICNIFFILFIPLLKYSIFLKQLILKV
jgi:hypothetical protein